MKTIIKQTTIVENLTNIKDFELIRKETILNLKEQGWID